MTKKHFPKIKSGFKKFKNRITETESLYKKILKESSTKTPTNNIVRIEDQKQLKEILRVFSPALFHEKSKYPLETIYEAGIHVPSGSLIISNKGATLYCTSPRSRTPFIARHIGMSVYMPGLGLEFVNVGLSGDTYCGKVVMRSESACAPSFLYGSQRCNCNHQWTQLQELAASFNGIKDPEIKDGKDFENWVQTLFHYDGVCHLPSNKTGSEKGVGFIMMHLDTQNGMGSGYTPEEFSFDLYARASIRHRGEYSSEQIHKTTMGGGFEAIGIPKDPRKEEDGIGYKITPIILDYLGLSKELIFLSNNPLKIKALNEGGYKIHRLPFMGEINPAGAQEAKERGTEFGHLNISHNTVSFEEDFKRVKEGIIKVLKENENEKK